VKYSQTAWRDRVDTHCLNGGVAAKRVGAAVDLLAYRVLKEPVHEDHVASSELFATTHLLLDHLAVVDDKLEIEIAHRSAGCTLAGRGLLDLAQAC
jgi:hypothetical protein